MPRTANRNKENKPTRTPVSGMRDILTVPNKNPNKVYRFVKSNDEDSMRLETFKRAGYEFTNPKENEGISVGERNVYKSQRNEGLSMIRYPVEADKDGNPQHLYLMEIPREYYEEDQALKQDDIDELEQSMMRKDIKPGDNETGQYGNVKISRKKGK